MKIAIMIAVALTSVGVLGHQVVTMNAAPASTPSLPTDTMSIAEVKELGESLIVPTFVPAVPEALPKRTGFTTLSTSKPSPTKAPTTTRAATKKEPRPAASSSPSRKNTRSEITTALNKRFYKKTDYGFGGTLKHKSSRTGRSIARSR